MRSLLPAPELNFRKTFQHVSLMAALFEKPSNECDQSHQFKIRCSLIFTVNTSGLITKDEDEHI